MVVQRMGSQGGGSNSIGGIQTQIRAPDPNLLVRQGSWYNLTLDEVQNQLGDLGKPLSRMNLDELLKTVWTAEANNQTTDGADNETAPGPLLSTDLSKKTVDEVWQDIQHGEKRSSLDREATLGEMTLEDFLVKAGVVTESAAGGTKSGPPRRAGGLTEVTQPYAQWMNYQMPSLHSQQQQSVMPVFMPGHPVQQSISIAGNPMMNAAYPETQVNMSSSRLMGTLSGTQTPGRKRVAPDEIAGKSVERRQKRMIKNRESAARSRARKQVPYFLVFCVLNKLI